MLTPDHDHQHHHHIHRHHSTATTPSRITLAATGTIFLATDNATIAAQAVGPAGVESGFLVIHLAQAIGAATAVIHDDCSR